jgi:hypothetical protein
MVIINLEVGCAMANVRAGQLRVMGNAICPRGIWIATTNANPKSLPACVLTDAWH